MEEYVQLERKDPSHIGGRKLNELEVKYNTTEREALAAVEALKQFRVLLWRTIAHSSTYSTWKTAREESPAGYWSYKNSTSSQSIALVYKKSQSNI